jgi:hypothetical protein
MNLARALGHSEIASDSELETVERVVCFRRSLHDA